MNLYDLKIDEFVDWTGDSSTQNLPVTGGRIRELIQEHIKKPVYMWNDKDKGMYRIFSSEGSFQKWYSLFVEGEDPDRTSDYIISSFVAPSEYEMLVTNLTGDPKYIREGDSNDAAANIVFRWDIIDSSKNTFDDSITVTYTFQNATFGEKSMTKIYTSTQHNISEYIYDYLAVGLTMVSVVMKSTNTSARYAIAWNVTMIKLDLTSTFPFYNFIPTTKDNVEVSWKLSSNNTSGSRSVYTYVDGNLLSKQEVPQGQSDYTSQSVYLKGEPGRHTVQLIGEQIIGSNVFHSNLLYYSYSVAEQIEVANKFINVGQSFDGLNNYLGQLRLIATQYEKFSMDWAYYTDRVDKYTSVDVQWQIKTVGDSTQYQSIAVITGTKNQQCKPVAFIPSTYTQEGVETFLTATVGDEEIISIPIDIKKSLFNIYETGNYVLKLSAYGRNNVGNQRLDWSYGSTTTDFQGMLWNDSVGWYNNSLRLLGEDSKAVVNYNPFDGEPSNGRTIEIEFESENIYDVNENIIEIGALNGGHIYITANSATLYSAAGDEIVKTNYKSNEHVKIAFIINPNDGSQSSNLAYIVTNGILERAGSHGGYRLNAQSGNIKIGGSRTGVRVFNIKVYNYAIGYRDAYNNYVFDSDDKASIIQKNNVTDDAGTITQQGCLNIIDTILISGDLSNLLDAGTGKDQSTSLCTIERICVSDPSKNFKIENAKIRKHGQSTLNYPVPSFKFWSNSKMDIENAPTPIMTVSEQQQTLHLSKNRYKMKDSSIPANKWILQANYADSSGSHNGSLQRLILDSWYNAKINGEYKLRTPPQLFATNQTITPLDDGQPSDNQLNHGKNALGRQWNDYFSGKQFPYQIRISPDSLPCVVFYKDTKDDSFTFLGQYVMMEDKKSDYCYGERSIYSPNGDYTDPFVLKTDNKGLDKKENKIWDNKNVLRIEVLNVNTKFVSYMADTIDGVGFDDIVAAHETEDDNGNTVQTPTQYRWEEDFELVYPDPDDLDLVKVNGVDVQDPNAKFDQSSEFYTVTRPFVSWFKWLVGTYNNHEKFRAEAAQHLDLYKLAAYYIFVLRFGLVDSLERNVQLKTYDGQHWWYEPWDMDIALGNKNTGGIAFDPPMDRNTKLDQNTWAISGKSNTTSNWLFDALEQWPYWKDTILPQVAAALANSGEQNSPYNLSYDNVIKMFDNEYVQAWCETIYNNSGDYKYIKSRGGDNSWLAWLQGARTTHRHWWLSTSMGYYDAKWGCGDFMKNPIYIAANHTQQSGQSNVDVVKIVPASDTFFKMTLNEQEVSGWGTKSATRTAPALYDITQNAFSTKTPVHIYGASNIAELDLSCIANSIDIIRLLGCYSKELGSQITDLNLGVPVTQVDDHYEGDVNGIQLTIVSTTEDGNDALGNLKNVNIRGQQNFGNFYDFINGAFDKSNLENVYAMGSSITGFYSSKSGNNFDTLELPDTIATFNVDNSSWKNITFWHTELGEPIYNGSLGADKNEDLPDDAEIGRTKNKFSQHLLDIFGIKYHIPSSLKNVSLMGSTGRQECSKKFVQDWIKSIDNSDGDFEGRTLIADDVYWEDITFEELSKIARFNNGDNSDGKNISGYIRLSSTELTTLQLSQIRMWFGNGVFTLNSAGLVVDCALNFTKVTVGPDAEIIDDEIYLHEGHRALVSATTFTLTNLSDETYWSLMDVGGSGEGMLRYSGCWIDENKLTENTYVVSDETYEGDRRIKLSGVPKGGSTGSVILNIIGVTYPEYIIKCNATQSNGEQLRQNGNVLTIPSSGRFEIYLDPEGEFTATLRDVSFSISKEVDGNVLTLLPITSYKTFAQGLNQYKTIDSILQYDLNATKKYSIPIFCETAPGTVNTYYFDMYIDIGGYTGSQRIVKSYTLNVIKDEPVSRTKDSYMYMALKNKYDTLFEEDFQDVFYKSTLINITGDIDFTGYSDQIETMNVLATDPGDPRVGGTIFQFLPNITSIVFENSPIRSTNLGANGVKQIDLKYCPLLTSISLHGCENLDGTIDFSNNPLLKQINISGCSNLDQMEFDLEEFGNLQTLNIKGTTSNVVYKGDENSLMRYLYMGKPTNVVLENCINLREFTIDDGSEVEEFNVIYCDRFSGAFSLLVKIIEDQPEDIIED